MPAPQVLPRKYMGMVEETQAELRSIAQKSRQICLALEAKRPGESIRVALQEIETTAYRLAFQLSELRFSSTCDGCPNAPSTTMAQAHLLMLAEELERQADLARRSASLTDEEKVLVLRRSFRQPSSTEVAVP